MKNNQSNLNPMDLLVVVEVLTFFSDYMSMRKKKKKRKKRKKKRKSEKGEMGISSPPSPLYIIFSRGRCLCAYRAIPFLPSSPRSA